MTSVKDPRRPLAEKAAMHEHHCLGAHPCASPDASGAARAAFRARLADGHVLASLMDEHVHILGALDRLEALLPSLEAGEPSAWAKVRELASFLLSAEPHHQREEEVLFPALRELGVTGPPAVMEEEHVQLRALKHRIHDLASGGAGGTPGGAGALGGAVREILSLLRQHIAKEDQILFPTAFSVIPDEAAWRAMRERCDAIGYCCGGPQE